MKQMIKPEIPVVGRYGAGRLSPVLIKGVDGEIFLLQNHGEFVIRFAVEEDGTISKNGDFEVLPGTPVDVIAPQSLGIELHFAR